MIHVSERRVAGPWVLCTECSAVMWQNGTGTAVPPVWDEACALRRAQGRSCSVGGSTIANIRQSALARWHRASPPATAGWPALSAKLVPGSGALVQGSMGAFPAGSHWRRWDPKFAGNHSVYVERRDTTDTVWWDDPLAPVGTYQGESMPMADLRRFVTGWAGAQHLVAALNISGGPNVATELPVTDKTPGTVALEAGRTMYDLAGVAGAVAVSTAQTAASPFGSTIGGKPYRAVYLFTGGMDQLKLVTPAGYVPEPVPADRYDQGRRDEWDTWNSLFPKRP